MFGELGWLTYPFAIRDVHISFIDAFFKSLERKRKPSAMAFPRVSRTPNCKQLDNKNKTFICWDFDSTPAPPDQAIFKYIPEKMVCAVRNCKLEGPVTIKVFAKTEIFNPFRKVLSRADIEVTDIKFKQGRQNAVSSKIPHDVGLLSVGDLSIANYIFITDNEFYAEVMRRLKKEGHKIILVQSEMIVAELIEIADVIWSFHNFVRGLPPFFIKDESETIAADERSTITMMIAQVMNVIHALCNNKSLPTRANIRKECPEGFNVKGALEYATGSGALTEEKLDEDRVYYPANEDMWVWLN
ncbi:putative endonuclease or glycosyl hydrolase [Trifolium repens]|nr:putative endonuclease or glycosyl hydrolase [Trifolium repens]